MGDRRAVLEGRPAAEASGAEVAGIGRSRRWQEASEVTGGIRRPSTGHILRFTRDRSHFRVSFLLL
jgi:hypothetical protein